MMVTGLRCWWQNHYVGDLFNVKIGQQHLKLSPLHLISNNRHQHRPLKLSWISWLQWCWWLFLETVTAMRYFCQQSKDQTNVKKTKIILAYFWTKFYGVVIGVIINGSLKERILTLNDLLEPYSRNVRFHVR